MKTITLILTSIGAVALGATAGAQGVQGGTRTTTDIPPALARQAKISLASARAIAMRRLPNASIQSQELERENGRLIYSFDMKVPGRSGIEEVNVNAVNGRVVDVSHEGPAAERQEAAAERKDARRSH